MRELEPYNASQLTVQQKGISNLLWINYLPQTYYVQLAYSYPTISYSVLYHQHLIVILN